MGHQHHVPMGSSFLPSPAHQDLSSQRSELSLQWGLPGTGSHWDLTCVGHFVRWSITTRIPQPG